MAIILLTILQLLGLILAAGAAVANLLKSKGIEEIKTPSLIIGGPETVTRRLTREARIGVVLIIAGVLVSFAARIVEQWLTTRRNNVSQQATSYQLQRAEEQIRLARESVTKIEEQALRSRIILTNVEQQGLIAKKSLDTLSLQSAQTRALLTNVALQADLATASLDALSDQSIQTRSVLTQVQRQNHLAEESQERARQQIDLANLSLQYIERLLTPLESLRVVAIYELSTNSFWASLALHYVAAYAGVAQEAATKFHSISRQGGSSAEFPAQIDQPWDLRAAGLLADIGRTETNDGSYIYSANVVGYVDLTNLTPVFEETQARGTSFYLGIYDIPGVQHRLVGDRVQTTIGVESLTGSFWKAALKQVGYTDWSTWMRAVGVLSHPDVKLEFVLSHTQTSDQTADLIIPAPTKPAAASLLFSPTSGRLALAWQYTSFSSNWVRCRANLSIPDLADSKLTISSGLPRKTEATNAVLRLISLQFGTSVVTLTNFHAVGGQTAGLTGATLPPRREIFSAENLR